MACPPPGEPPRGGGPPTRGQKELETFSKTKHKSNDCQKPLAETSKSGETKTSNIYFFLRKCQFDTNRQTPSVSLGYGVAQQGTARHGMAREGLGTARYGKTLARHGTEKYHAIHFRGPYFWMLGNLEIWDLEIWIFWIEQKSKNSKSQNQNPCRPKCPQGLD